MDFPDEMVRWIPDFKSVTEQNCLTRSTFSSEGIVCITLGFYS